MGSSRAYIYTVILCQAVLSATIGFSIAALVGLGRSDKAAFRNHAFGVVDAEARMGSVDLVEGVHDLGRERGVTLRIKRALVLSTAQQTSLAQIACDALEGRAVDTRQRGGVA